MFHRHDDPEPAVAPEPQRAPDPEPVPEPNPLPISMFGSRAEKQARFGPPLNPKTIPPRLVSIGRQTHKDPGSSRQKGRIWEYEAYVDMQRPHQKWIRWPGEKEPQRADDVTYKSDPPPEPLGTIPRRPDGPSAHFPAGQDNQIIPPPDISDEERRLARAMFARADGPSDPPPRPAFDACPW